MRKKYWKTGCVIATLLCLTACGKAQTGEITPLADNMIHLYLAEDNTVVRADADYQLKTPDAIASCVEDAMTALTAMETSKIEAYSYMMGEDNSLQMDITLGEGSYEQEDILLIMAATTKTLFQMDDISSIALTVKGHDEKVYAEQLFLRDSVYYYGTDEPSLAEESITMYAPNAQGTALESYGIKVQSEPQTSDQEYIVRELVQKKVLSPDTKVNQVSVHDSVCYLDLSEEFTNAVGTISPELALYAVVNSVIAQTDVDTVQILIDGKIVPMYRNVVAIDKPLPFNANVVQE